MIGIWKKVGKERFTARYVVDVLQETNTSLQALFRKKYIISVGTMPNTGILIWQINSLLYQELSEHDVDPKTSLGSAAFIEQQKQEFLLKSREYLRRYREKSILVAEVPA
jgi:hypothetical protein